MRPHIVVLALAFGCGTDRIHQESAIDRSISSSAVMPSAKGASGISRKRSPTLAPLAGDDFGIADEREGLPEDQKFAAQKLRTYCRACHGVGTQRFIYSDNDDELWEYISTQRAPISGKVWKDAIIDVLAWPSDRAPPVDEIMDPINNRDWMPKGAKRQQLAEDVSDGKVVRRMMLEALRR